MFGKGREHAGAQLLSRAASQTRGDGDVTVTTMLYYFGTQL